jgi:hypothetical protein
VFQDYAEGIRVFPGVSVAMIMGNRVVFWIAWKAKRRGSEFENPIQRIVPGIMVPFSFGDGV